MTLSLRRARPLVALAAASLGTALLAAPAFAAEPGWTVVASGLDNPRGLAFTPDGTLYVAEAGRGGDAADAANCLELPGDGEEGGTLCVDLSGAIAAVTPRGVKRVVTGLVSTGDGSGFGATGPDGLSAQGNGGLYTIMTESASALAELPSGAFTAPIRTAVQQQLGRVVKGTPGGSWKVTADVGDVDYRWTQQHADLVPGQFPDANPYGILAEPGGQWVVDAGSNTLDRVSPNGSVEVVAFIPSPPQSDAVPTCLDRGPDGALYIGELTGGGNGPGDSVVWRVEPGQQPEQWATGLTAVTGCGFGADGRFYASEFSTLGLEGSDAGTGAVVRAVPGGTPELVAGGLSFPGGLALGPDGALYVSNWSIAPADTGGGPTGEIVRIRP